MVAAGGRFKFVRGHSINGKNGFKFALIPSLA